MFVTEKLILQKFGNAGYLKLAYFFIETCFFLSRIPNLAG